VVGEGVQHRPRCRRPGAPLHRRETAVRRIYG
jgi:hypothetical protein